MSFLDKLQVELNRAGRAAQDAIDEGRLRLEIFRVRQLADKAAQALGYAVYRAKAKGEEMDSAAWDRLTATLREHEAEATRLDAELTKVTNPTPAAETAAEAPTEAPSEAAAEAPVKAAPAGEATTPPAESPPSA